jgi:hypothetical protein
VRFPVTFWKRRSCASVGEPLRFPIPFAGRIALLDRTLPSEVAVRRFDPADLRSLADFAPEALVAPLDIALSLADRRVRGLSDLSDLTVAVVVLTTIEDSPLEDHHRDLMWHAFKVPVFEQLRGDDGGIVARECEVHHGLHISDSLAAQFSSDAALELMHDPCECGSETPRLIHQRNSLSALRPRIFSRSVEVA